MERRNFLSRLALAFSAILGVAVAQKAILENGKAVVCATDSLKCPLGHATCATVNAPLAIGNDSYQNPDVQQLRDFHVVRCDVCHMLFTIE